METSSIRQQKQRERNISPLEESFEDYSVPPSVSPIHALRHPSAPTYTEGDNDGDGETTADLEKHRQPWSDASSQSASSLHEDDAHNHSRESDLRTSPATADLNFNMQYRQARARQTSREGEGSADISQRETVEKPPRTGGFLQLGLGRLKADLAEIDHYAKLHENAQRAAGTPRQQRRQSAQERAKTQPQVAGAEHASHPATGTPLSPNRRSTAAARSTPGRRAEEKGKSLATGQEAPKLDTSNASSASSPPPRPVRTGSPRISTMANASGNTSGSVAPTLPSSTGTADGTDAFTRLYVEAQERSRRLERRRERLQKDREMRRRSSCSFRPSLTPWDEVPESLSRGDENDDRGAAEHRASQPRKSISPRSRGENAPSYTNFDEFLVAQEEREARRRERLAVAARMAQEKEAPGLLRSVPPSAVREKLDAYLVKEKGYVDPVTGWQERFQAYLAKRNASSVSQRPHLPGGGGGGTPRRASAGGGLDSSASRPSRAGSQKGEAAAMTPDSARGTRHLHLDGTSVNGHQTAKTDGAIFERLYQESASRASARRLLALMQMEHESQQFFQPNRGNRLASSSRLADDASGRDGKSDSDEVDSALASSRSSSTSSQLPGSDAGRPSASQPNATSVSSKGIRRAKPSVFEELYAEKDDIARRRELARMAVEDDEDLYTFQPHINPRSRELIVERAQAIARGERAAPASECSGNPDAPPPVPHYQRQRKCDARNGSEGGGGGGGGRGTASREMRQEGPRGQMRSSCSASSPSADAEDKVATPRGQQQQQQPHRRGRAGGGEGSAEAFQQRVALYAERRRAKLLSARIAEEMEELRECTFRPNLSLLSRSMASSAPGGAMPTSAATTAATATVTAAAPAPPSSSQGPVVEGVGGAPARENSSYAQLMETPEVKRALWTGVTTTTQGPKPGQVESTAPRTQDVPPPAKTKKGGGRSRSLTASQTTVRHVRSHSGGSAASAADRARPDDPTPAGPLPLHKLLPTTALDTEHQRGGRTPAPIARALSIDLGSPALQQGGSGGGGGGSVSTPYFRPASFYCEQDAAAKAGDDSVGAGEGEEVVGRGGVPGERAGKGSQDTEDGALDKGRRRRVASTDEPSALPLADETATRAEMPPPQNSSPNKEQDPSSHQSPPRPAVTPQRPPLSPHRRIDYGLAGVHGTDHATPSELATLERELRGVMDEWTERLQQL